MVEPNYDISTDGITVWVNRAWCIGRFGLYGIDIHREPTKQIQTQCLFCTHTQLPISTTLYDWELFRVKMVQLHGIQVPDRYRPERLIGGVLNPSQLKRLCRMSPDEPPHEPPHAHLGRKYILTEPHLAALKVEILDALEEYRHHVDLLEEGQANRGQYRRARRLVVDRILDKLTSLADDKEKNANPGRD